MRHLDLNELVSVRTEGGLLPAELLQRIAAGDPDVPGISNADYLLEAHERLRAVVNDSWNSLKGSWAAFRDAVRVLPTDDPAVKLTRDRWLFPLFHRLDYGRRLPKAPSYTVDGRPYPVSHHFEHVPIHLLGCGVSLDHPTPGVTGAARRSPHGMVQELLNRSDDHLWAILTNGYRLRILRDHQSLSRQAYVEFDLESMFEGDQFSEFLLLWLVCHQSRIRAKPAECWLERWFEQARQDGVRALDRLRDGVKAAIESLGAGFLAQPSNRALREALLTRQLDPQDYYRELLRMVYRLIFLFVAEDREVDGREALLDPEAPQEAVELFRAFYSTQRLRRLARRRLAGGGHVDLWRMLRLVMEKLSDGYAPLALPGLDGYLFSAVTLPHLAEAELSNEALLDAVWAMDHITDSGVHRRVNWRHIGSEELGSVYEALLELVPVMEIKAEPPTFRLDTVAGNERKTTGSFYTPSSLVDCLLDSTLDPVLDKAARQENPEAAILALKVCDPACGSGHFLVAAARRMAARLAAVRAGEDEPSPTEVQHALRDVVGRCLYGVDINPMAIELCKVSLWMEALEPGRPLSFLDHHLQVGNSLLGATPALLEGGIPDGAFKPIEGDDKAYCTVLKRRNKRERESGQTSLFLTGEAPSMRRAEALEQSFTALAGISQNTVDDVRAKEARYRQIRGSEAYRKSRLLADAWCAAFVWRKTKDEPELTEDVFRKIEIESEQVPAEIPAKIRDLAEQYQFLHPHLAFPDVFHVPGVGKESENPSTGLSGGFDVMLGNPPWDKVQVEELKFFAHRDQNIAALTGNERKRAIAQLASSDPALFEHWNLERRRILGSVSIIRGSGAFPLTGVGKFNTYALFAEISLRWISGVGRAGLVVPTGIATDATTKQFFQEIIDRQRLQSLLDFENRQRIFPAIDSRIRFCLISFGCAGTAAKPEFMFYGLTASDLENSELRFCLSGEDIARINPNTRTCPSFRNRKQADLCAAIFREIPVLAPAQRTDDLWDIRLHRMLNASDDSNHFIDTQAVTFRDGKYFSAEEPVLPFYEAKTFHQFDHRWPKGVESTDPQVATSNDYRKLVNNFVPEALVTAYLETKTWGQDWLICWRDIARANDWRTAIGTVIPLAGLSHTAFAMYPQERPAETSILLSATLSAFVFDFCARQKLTSAHLTKTQMEQLPFLSPSQAEAEADWAATKSRIEWMRPRVLELTYTAWDLQGYAQDCGYEGPPFRWDEVRRFVMRCELDAAFFHLYGIERDDVDYIMDTFPIVEKKDLKAYGEYRTKIEILEIYDRMQHAIDTGEPYQTHLDPQPADSRIAHPYQAVSKMASLSDGLWTRPMADPEAEQLMVLAAVLKTNLGAIPRRQVRLAALLATCPELLNPSLTAEEVAHWRRLIGAEAETTRARDSRARLPEDSAWGTAVRQLRGMGALVEDLDAQTWAAGEKLREIPTAGWPAGRVAVVMEILRRREAEDLAQTLPENARAWIDAEAA